MILNFKNNLKIQMSIVNNTFQFLGLVFLNKIYFKSSILYLYILFISK
jgi:hypothetical protein